MNIIHTNNIITTTTSTIINNYNSKDNKHFGFIQIWFRDSKGNFKRLWSYTLQEWQYVIIDQKNMKIISPLNPKNNKTMNPKCDYYYTPNPMKSATKRGLSELRAIATITVDIDNSSQFNTFKSDKDRLLALLQAELIDNGELPNPTVSTLSGRGVQLTWEIEQSAIAMSWLYKIVIEDILETIDGFLDKHDELMMYHVDHGASKNMGGLMRIGGINQKSNIKVEHYPTGEKYTIDEMIGILDTNIRRRNTVNLSTHTTHLETPSEALMTVKERSALVGRTRQIEQLQALRIGNNTYTKGDISRNELNFLYLNTILPLDSKEALIKLDKFNNRFPNPTPQNEIKAMINTVEKRGIHKFKNKTFKNWLNLQNADEEEAIKLDRNHTRTATRQEQQRRQEARIESLLDNGKLTYKDMAERLECSVPTVKRYAKKYGIKRNYQASK